MTYCQQFMTNFTFQKNKNTDTSKGIIHKHMTGRWWPRHGALNGISKWRELCVTLVETAGLLAWLCMPPSHESNRDVKVKDEAGKVKELPDVDGIRWEWHLLPL